jgi:hypothetical protein
MTKKQYENIKEGSTVVKAKGETVLINHTTATSESHVLDEDVIGQVTKIDPNYPDFVYVLWPGFTHSERIRYTDLKGI